MGLTSSYERVNRRINSWLTKGAVLPDSHCLFTPYFQAAVTLDNLLQGKTLVDDRFQPDLQAGFLPGSERVNEKHANRRVFEL